MPAAWLRHGRAIAGGEYVRIAGAQTGIRQNAVADGDPRRFRHVDIRHHTDGGDDAIGRDHGAIGKQDAIRSDRGEALPEGARLQFLKTYYDRYFTDEALDTADRFVATAQARGLTPAQLALAWVLAEPRVTCPIVGARNLEQFQDTVAGLEVTLTPEEREAIPAVRPGHWHGLDPVYDRKM